MRKITGKISELPSVARKDPVDFHADLSGKTLRDRTNFLLTRIIFENIAELCVCNFNKDLLDVGKRQAVRKHA